MPSNHAFILTPKKYEATHVALLASVNPQQSDAIDRCLKGFTAHTLAQQNRCALMDRVDTKYLLPKSSLKALLAVLVDDYTILEDKQVRSFNYQTTYFDTPKKYFYLAHHNGKLNRVKVRMRHYVESNMGFMEVKLKNNKRRTIKNRVPMDYQFPDEDKIHDFVKDSIGGNEQHLETSLYVNYRRITLLNRHRSERLTLDLDVSFQCAKGGNTKILENAFIVELKRDGKQGSSCFSRWIKEHSVNSIKFSKYCMGLAFTYGLPLKKNRFKTVMTRIDNITNNKNIIGNTSWN
jgi:hypothetical protein